MPELLAVITITLFAVVSPGPDFAMVSRNSMMVSRRAGVCTAFGIGAGVSIHVAYTILGVGLLAQQSLWLFKLIKLAGAVYLVYLGAIMLRTRAGSETHGPQMAHLSDARALCTGFLTNALNPKTMVFIVSLFMQVVTPSTPIAVQIGYGAFIAWAHIVWFSIVALFFAADAVRRRLLAVRHWIDRAFGGILVGFGAIVAFSRI